MSSGHDVFRIIVKENGHLYRAALQTQYPEVIPAPQWLRDRMEELRKKPVPPYEKVVQQFAASSELRKK